MCFARLGPGQSKIVHTPSEIDVFRRQTETIWDHNWSQFSTYIVQSHCNTPFLLQLSHSMKTQKQIHQKIETSEKAEDVASGWVKESVGDFILFCSKGVGGILLVHYMCYMFYFSMFMIDVGEIWLYTQLDHQRKKESSTHPKRGTFRKFRYLPLHLHWLESPHRLVDFRIWRVCFGSTLHPVTVVNSPRSFRCLKWRYWTL